MNKIKLKIENILRALALVSSLFLGAGLAFAQNASTTPGTPTTAAGGFVLLNLFLLAFSVLIISAGVIIARDRKNQVEN